MPSVCGVMSTSTGPDVDSRDQAALDGGAHGHAQIGVHLGVDGLAELLLEQLAYHGRVRRPPPTRTTLSI